MDTGLYHYCGFGFIINGIIAIQLSTFCNVRQGRIIAGDALDGDDSCGCFAGIIHPYKLQIGKKIIKQPRLKNVILK